jgi:hypothetical protein
MPLWVSLAAAQWLDIVWPLFVLTGIERVEVAPGDTAFTPLAFVHYPWSHSLVMSIAWGVAFAAVVRALGASWRVASICGALVVSHWVLDFASHRPDMPLWPAGPSFGLGLWRSVPATLAIELTMFGIGVALYARATRARDRVGTIAFWSLAFFLLGLYLIAAVAPPPPSARAVASSGIALWLIPLWGYWIERHRNARTAPQ